MTSNDHNYNDVDDMIDQYMDSHMDRLVKNDHTCIITYGVDYLKNTTFYGIKTEKYYVVFWSLQKLYGHIIKHNLIITDYINQGA